MKPTMKKALGDTLLQANLCNEAGIEASIGIIELKAAKLDKCGKPNCNHEHVIPSIITSMKQDKKPKTVVSRMEQEKQELLKKGFKPKRRP